MLPLKTLHLCPKCPNPGWLLKGKSIPKNRESKVQFVDAWFKLKKCWVCRIRLLSLSFLSEVAPGIVISCAVTEYRA